ncbi:5-oxoprolinase subunit B family protein [Nocardia sp. NBC_01329]|uniref:5-oxoprolinase subunit B family protein n=1 Tax=Nocardia sp. NBC_01329 TaxID=2903594 RepID=UPI002E158FC0|nr:allophanate hydrolase subunit 1 [Nocardia sp. NBC_01329]
MKSARPQQIRETGPAAIRCAGDRAFLVTPADPGRVGQLVAALSERTPAGVVDFLPAAETVLITLDSVGSAARVRRGLEQIVADVSATERDVSRGTFTTTTEPLQIPVRYDGPDLECVADMLDMRPEQVISAHTAAVWHCAFVGFAPGFGYLTAADWQSKVVRRSAARTRIPAGSVGLADSYTAVYPRETPGGWQLIGTTDLTMWDTGREPPALVRAGARVRFVDVDAAS